MIHLDSVGEDCTTFTTTRRNPAPWRSGEALDAVQTGFDVAGVLPDVGELFDGAHALISLARGDAAGAALAAAALISGAGIGATSAKLAARYGDEALAPLHAGTYAELSADRVIDAHHIIQHAAVRDLPGYDKHAAPAVHLPGPSNVPGTPHYLATQVQRQANGGGSYAAERRIAYRALRAAGLTPGESRALITTADAYFASIGVTPSTTTRIPGNRR